MIRVSSVATLIAILVIKWATPALAANISEVPTLYVIENLEAEQPLSSRLAVVDAETGGTSKVFPRQSYIRLSGLTYDLSTDSMFGLSRQSSSLLRIDRGTGSYTLVGRVDWGAGGVRDLSINPINNELYGITLLGELVRLDKETAERTLVGSDSQFRFAHGLAFSPDGRLFAADTVGPGSRLYEIDVDTGAATQVATIDRDYIVSLDFHTDGRLFGLDNGAKGIVTIDTVTGQATAIASFGDDTDRQALAFATPIPEPISIVSLSAMGCIIVLSGGRKLRW